MYLLTFRGEGTGVDGRRALARRSKKTKQKTRQDHPATKAILTDHHHDAENLPIPSPPPTPKHTNSLHQAQTKTLTNCCCCLSLTPHTSHTLHGATTLPIGGSDSLHSSHPPSASGPGLAHRGVRDSPPSSLPSFSFFSCGSRR